MPKRSRNIYEANTEYKLSRNKLKKFMECAHCFYLDRHEGINQPEGLPFTLHSAVDALLKKEFDIYREKKEVHPQLAAVGINVIPFSHPKLNAWRNNFVGLQYKFPETNLLLTGAIDDLWVDEKPDEKGIRKLYVVDYKATSSSKEPTLDDAWKINYKQQVEFYRYLLEKTIAQSKAEKSRYFDNIELSNIAYFFYVNADKSKEKFDQQLVFKTSILAHVCNSDWIEDKVKDAYECLQSPKAPEFTDTCDYCKLIKLNAEYYGVNMNTPKESSTPPTPLVFSVGTTDPKTLPFKKKSKYLSKP